MLKKIPQEQLDAEDIKKLKSAKKKAASKKTSRNRKKKAPSAALQKKVAVISKAECKVIRNVGLKLLCYGKKSFNSNKDFQRLIQDVQRSVLYLQKQQRKFIRDQGIKDNNKKHNKKGRK